ncbi:hypothetical protein B0H66DRAFT_119239 [Apodospora peruviana]|uniref:Uncharacterized protein n=1 Tax=Apodospora peruviana TaxID=516989 RepID=A0AAE0MAF4_9PEZI|nr:hypothetical protein B0H66DRAFT_119239 [Apodospora peruviana]
MQSPVDLNHRTGGVLRIRPVRDRTDWSTAPFRECSAVVPDGRDRYLNVWTPLGLRTKTKYGHAPLHTCPVKTPDGQVSDGAAFLALHPEQAYLHPHRLGNMPAFAYLLSKAVSQSKDYRPSQASILPTLPSHIGYTIGKHQVTRGSAVVSSHTAKRGCYSTTTISCIIFPIVRFVAGWEAGRSGDATICAFHDEQDLDERPLLHLNYDLAGQSSPAPKSRLSPVSGSWFAFAMAECMSLCFRKRLE